MPLGMFQLPDLPPKTTTLMTQNGWHNGRREEIGKLSAFRTSFGGQVLCNPSFCGTQIAINNHGNRLVVNPSMALIVEPDYRIPIVLLGVAGGLAYTENLVSAVPVGLLGLLLLVQATRVRFVFGDEALEVRIGDQLEESGENAFVGGKNRWKYSTFINWEFWWPNFPNFSLLQGDTNKA
ncbi:uncharacterized protein LOC107460026 [Arachis duranensis]|uniref:Uncharacterized protein LOC107460026 n=1 Tax=Arachis duranensis TaxID=130453 RepID=A0A6P4B4K3_ARADU|nr:uncharacterized protein LOC107460026 [Arachis duranensis]